MMRYSATVVVLVLLTSVRLYGELPPLVPQPLAVKEAQGEFLITAKTRIFVSPLTDDTRRVARDLTVRLNRAAGFDLPLLGSLTDTGNTIRLSFTDEPDPTGEAYTVTVGTEGVTILAASAAGLFNGVQTLRQLLPPQIESPVVVDGVAWRIPCVTIKDAPRFSWRGLMLDESRHFFGKLEVKKLLDRMALLKLNRFHWHLTDDPGWRVEIKKYPKLTSVGGIGCETDASAPACFYSQDDVRDILAFAADRHIVVVPEIDMPGHATAMNTAYPEHWGGGFERLPKFLLNPGREATYAYLRDILKEIAELFPGPWLHYGGDEATFAWKAWLDQPDVRDLMLRENLKTPEGIDHYFKRRMATAITGLGKTTCGWDEITDAGLAAETTVVFWWRHDKPKQRDKAIERGYRVVLCPRQPLYFDFVQADSHKYGRRWDGPVTLERIIGFPQLPAAYTAAQRRQVLGLQCCLWTEKVKSVQRLEFMLFPRLAAVAESAWLPEGGKDYGEFMRRLKRFLVRLDVMGITCFNPFEPQTSVEPAL